jgi:hypothetical protein
MTDDDVLLAAHEDGFELEERVLGHQWVWGWHRDDDERWPCYLTRHEAVRWMADRLSRVRVFALSVDRATGPLEAVGAEGTVDRAARLKGNVGELVQAVKRAAARCRVHAVEDGMDPALRNAGSQALPRDLF